MSLICFSNGSLAREKIREQHQVDWEYFDKTAMQETVPGNNGKLMLPYFEAESTPPVLQIGVIRNYTAASAAEEIRAILESQMLSMRLHTQWLGEEIHTLRLTGGGSKSPALRQIAADVFDAEVEVIQVTNSAGLGSAMRAADSIAGVPLEELAKSFCAGTFAAAPQKENKHVYRELLEKYRNLEKMR